MTVRRAKHGPFDVSKLRDSTSPIIIREAKTANVFMPGVGSGYVQPDLQAAADLRMKCTSKASEIGSCEPCGFLAVNMFVLRMCANGLCG
jgi:hypothetical protein